MRSSRQNPLRKSAGIAVAVGSNVRRTATAGGVAETVRFRVPSPRDFSKSGDAVPAEDEDATKGHNFSTVRVHGDASKDEPRVHPGPRTEDQPRQAAPAAKKCKIKSGPTYKPSGTIKAKKSGGTKTASFDLTAEFENDTATGADPSCCEARQFILWTKAEDIPNHDGFKPAKDYSDNTWYEDRDSAKKRYGRRTGPYSECIDGNHYEDTDGTRNCPSGAVFKGHDAPMDGSGKKTGLWKFQLKVIDVCNGDAEIGTPATVTVDWNV